MELKTLEALCDINHGGEHLAPGERFSATAIDADYYIARGKAKIADAVKVETFFLDGSGGQPGRVIAASGDLLTVSADAGDSIDPPAEAPTDEPESEESAATAEESKPTPARRGGRRSSANSDAK